MLHRCIEGERVGDDGGEVVGVDLGGRRIIKKKIGATGSKGERAPLLLLLLLP